MLEKQRAQKKPSEQKTYLMVDKFTREAVEKIHFDFDEEKKKAEERRAKRKHRNLGQNLSSKYGWSTIKAWLCLTHTNYKAKTIQPSTLPPFTFNSYTENSC